MNYLSFMHFEKASGETREVKPKKIRRKKFYYRTLIWNSRLQIMRISFLFPNEIFLIEIHFKSYLSIRTITLCLVKLPQNKNTRVFSDKENSVFFLIYRKKENFFFFFHIFYGIFSVILFFWKKKIPTYHGEFQKCFIRVCEISKRTAIATPRKNRDPVNCNSKKDWKNYLFKLNKKIKWKVKRNNGNINKNSRIINKNSWNIKRKWNKSNWNIKKKQKINSTNFKNKFLNWQVVKTL